MASTTVTENQDRGGVRVVVDAIGGPPMTEAITRKFTGIMTGTQWDIADIEVPVITTMRNNDPISITGKIVVVGEELFPRV